MKRQDLAYWLRQRSFGWKRLNFISLSKFSDIKFTENLIQLFFRHHHYQVKLEDLITYVQNVQKLDRQSIIHHIRKYQDKGIIQQEGEYLKMTSKVPLRINQETWYESWWIGIGAISVGVALGYIIWYGFNIASFIIIGLAIAIWGRIIDDAIHTY